jgi:hypothetical protein
MIVTLLNWILTLQGVFNLGFIGFQKPRQQQIFWNGGKTGSMIIAI